MEQITSILDKAESALSNCSTIHELEQMKASFIGKNGDITKLMQHIKDIPADERKQFGAMVNSLKKSFEDMLLSRKEAIEQIDLAKSLAKNVTDVTLAGRGYSIGGLHPISLSLERMIKIFTALGFSVADGPEIENDFYNFSALNIPPNHPARAMQDTFYTESMNVLRTHTSPIQVRFAQQHKPPFKVVAPGRVYRVDMDATHSPMFHQLEGLWIDKNISFADLKGLIIQFLHTFFNDANLEVRFRASFFPFTEPSAEVDIKMSGGKWLEVLGCGMVHPNVLKAMNVDSDQYSGFAFGLGIDRLTMLRYGISDLRLMFENDLDFLSQFNQFGTMEFNQ